MTEEAIADHLRAVVEAHEPAQSSTQWYADEHVIDCDAGEFWSVTAAATASAEAAIIKRALAAAYRQQTGWTDDSAAQREFRDLAAQVEAFEPGDACCPCCQEVTCDAGCPLEPVRKAAQEVAAQVVRGEVIHDDAPRLLGHLERARPDTAVPVVSLTPEEFEAFTRKHGVRWEEA